MELPDDVIQLIREYTKPRFKYFREYNSAKKRFRLIYFPNIKPCLMKNPDRILPVLKRLEYWDEAFIRVSNDFQKRYFEYVDSGEAQMKRDESRLILDELLYVRKELCRIAYSC